MKVFNLYKDYVGGKNLHSCQVQSEAATRDVESQVSQLMTAIFISKRMN